MYSSEDVKSIVAPAFVLDSIFQIIVWSSATDNFVAEKMVLSMIYFVLFMISIVAGCRL